MKKVILIPMLSLFIIVGLFGCTNETSNPKSSPTHETNIPTKPSTSSSKEAIDYNKFTKKVWIVKSWDEGAYEYSSFCISEIKNGVIKGKFSTLDLTVPGYYYYIPDHLGFLGNLSGTINNGIAECKFSDKNGNKGNLELVFKSSDEIETTIKYTKKSQIYKDKSLDGTFLFRPYNIRDLDGFRPFDDNCFSVDLKIWGNVNFVSGKQFSGLHIPTLAFLTSKDGDILYDFTWFIPTNVEFKDVSFQDINKDGLKDIIIVIYGGAEDTEHAAIILLQKSNGSFEGIDEDLNLEINNSGNNRDIETITEYLSKKF